MIVNQPIKIGIVDDHKLFRKGIISLIEFLDADYEIVLEADNGIELQKTLKADSLPDIVLMDVNMPGMDGYESVKWLKESHPQVSVLVLSMIEQEESIVNMLKLGVKGYICKDVEPEELHEALQAVANKGYYYTDYITGKLVHAIQEKETNPLNQSKTNLINDREMEFLKFACTELTYKEIADKMCLSPKTIDGYRNNLFEKLKVKSRVGLALFAVKHKLVDF